MADPPDLSLATDGLVEALANVEKSTGIETAHLQNLVHSLRESLRRADVALDSLQIRSDDGGFIRDTVDSYRCSPRRLYKLLDTEVLGKGVPLHNIGREGSSATTDRTAYSEEPKTVMHRFQQTLLNDLNSLTLTLHLGAVGSDHAATPLQKQVRLTQEHLERSCEWLYHQDIFPPASPTSNTHKRRSSSTDTSLTFTLREAEVKVTPPRQPRTTYEIICPRTSLPDSVGAGFKLQFQCFCANNDHKASLAYEVYSERSIPVEETGPDSESTWQLFLRKANALVAVRLSSLLPPHVAQLEALSALLAKRLHNTPRLSSSEVLMTSEQSVSVLCMKACATLLGLQLTGVKFVVAGRTTKTYSCPWPPQYLQIFQYGTASKESLEAARQNCDNMAFLDEPHFLIFISKHSPKVANRDQTSPIELFKVQVSYETHIERHAGSSVVTVVNVDCTCRDAQPPRSIHCSAVQYTFSNEKSAEGFLHHLKNFQQRLLEKSLQRPAMGEEVVFRHATGALLASTPGVPSAQVLVIHKPAEKRHRIILTFGDESNFICYDLASISPEDASGEWSKILPSQMPWTLDVAHSGRISAKRLGWDKLKDRAARSKQEQITDEGIALARVAQLSSQRWLDELEVVNGVLNAPKGNRDYTHVKVAVIDTGLNPRYTNSASIVKYRDFTVATKAADGKGLVHKENTGKPEDEPKDQMIDDMEHGTAMVQLVLRIYEDAQLHVNRVFKTDQFNAVENVEPYLMADAIDWAVWHKVDIISISAGFKTCPLELYDAVHRAHAARILVFASAGNWSYLDPPAFPAAIEDHVFCIFSTNSGLRDTRDFNPRGREKAHNFAFLGENIALGPHRGAVHGTSAATAIAAGFAARILDFSRQPDCREDITNVSLLGTKTGMTAVFDALASDDGMYECVRPKRILREEDDDESGRKGDYGDRKQRARQRVREFLSRVLRNPR